MDIEPSLARLRDRIVAAAQARAPLRLRGSGTKDFYGESLLGDVLDTREYSGILSYEPSELVITARCGTALSEIERALAAHDQYLAFEPPSFTGDPTLGGIVAAGLSGPRRATAGAVRDYVLGVHLLDARGELLRFGGQVMKNVAGFDVSRLLCGSLGILGLITNASVKVMPRPRTEISLMFELDASEAVRQFNEWGGKALPISATSWREGRACVRLSGSVSAVRAAQTDLGGQIIDAIEAAPWWNGLRNQTNALFNSAHTRIHMRLWRLSCPSTAPVETLPAELIEWGGALRWILSDAPAAAIRSAAVMLGGTATLWRGHRDASIFHPLSTHNLELHRRLKAQFDPLGIFNVGRLVTDL